MSLYDENAEVLRDLERRGNDLGPPRPVDFAHLFSSEQEAMAFAEASKSEGFEAVVEALNDEDTPWDVRVSRVMIPSCQNITDAEERLGLLAKAHGGNSDGWGFFNP